MKVKDVGVVLFNAGQYVENTGENDLVFLELFKASEVLDFSLNQWIRRLPPEMVYSHLKLDRNAIQTIPAEKLEIVPRYYFAVVDFISARQARLPETATLAT